MFEFELQRLDLFRVLESSEAIVHFELHFHIYFWVHDITPLSFC